MPGLGAFSGIPSIEAALAGLTVDLYASLSAQQKFDATRGQWTAGTATTTGEGTSAATGYAGVAWGESLTPAQKIAMGLGVTPGADSAAVAASFKALADKIDKFQGDTNNYWSQLLNKEIPYLTTGATSAASAEGMISTILKVFLPGMEQELQNPKTPKEMRDIVAQLLQFAQSGHLQTDKLAADLDLWLKAHGG